MHHQPFPRPGKPAAPLLPMDMQRALGRAVFLRACGQAPFRSQGSAPARPSREYNGKRRGLDCPKTSARTGIGDLWEKKKSGPFGPSTPGGDDAVGPDRGYVMLHGARDKVVKACTTLTKHSPLGMGVTVQAYLGGYRDADEQMGEAGGADGAGEAEGEAQDEGEAQGDDSEADRETSNDLHSGTAARCDAVKRPSTFVLDRQTRTPS